MTHRADGPIRQRDLTRCINVKVHYKSEDGGGNSVLIERELVLTVRSIVQQKKACTITATAEDLTEQEATLIIQYHEEVGKGLKKGLMTLL